MPSRGHLGPIGVLAGIMDLWGHVHDVDERPGEVVALGVAPVRWHEQAAAEVQAELARMAAMTSRASVAALRAAVPAVGTPVVLRWTDPDAGRKTRVRKTEGAIEAITTSGIRIRSLAGYRATCTWNDLPAQQANLRSPAGALLLGGDLRRDAEAGA